MTSVDDRVGSPLAAPIAATRQGGAVSGAPAPATRGIGYNAAILSGATILCKMGSLAVAPFILRAFPRGEYGEYSAAFAYAGLLGMITYFGMGPVVVRDIARGERPKGSVVFHCAALRMALLILAGAGLALLGAWKGFSPRMWVLAWMGFAVMGFDALTGAIKGAMQAEGRFGLLAGVDAARKASQWAIAIVVITAGMSIVGLAGGVVIAAAAATGAAAWLGMSAKDFRGVRFAPGYAAQMLRLSAPMGLSAAFVLALERVDIWVIDALRGPADVGVYAAAAQFKPVFLAQSVVWAMLPLAFRLGKDDRPGLAQAVRKSGRYLFISGGALALAFFCGGRVLMPILGGGQYAASVPVFEIMGLTLPFVFVSFLYLHALTAVDRQPVAAGIFALGLAVNIALDVLLVPRWGAAGAMTGTLAAEAVMAACAFAAVWRIVGRPAAARDIRALAAFGGGAAAALLTWRAGIADMGIIAGGVFAALLVVLRAVGLEDMALLRRSFTRRQ